MNSSYPEAWHPFPRRAARFLLAVAVAGPLTARQAPRTPGVSPGKHSGIASHIVSSPFRGQGGSVRDLAGKERRVPEPKAKATVVLFVAHDCPVSNQYAPEVNRIVKQYAPRGIAFLIAYAEPQLSAKEAAEHARSYGYRCPVMLDHDLAVTRKLKADVTPEAIVLDPDGKTIYRGRIDDLYVELGKRRYEATVHDLRNSLDSVLSGKPRYNRITKPIGCFIDVKR